MSADLIREPITNGRIVLRTNFGEIDIELWSNECSNASKNFIQHCLDGYYNDCEFYQILPDSHAKCGDPTNTGNSGKPAFENSFPAEVNRNIMFTRRGLIAFECEDKIISSSRFFITFNALPNLNGKYTIFGSIVGNTIYNFIKLNELSLDGYGKPFSPHKIISTEVISNPFPNLEKRVAKRERDEKELPKEKTQVKSLSNKKLLSFGNDDETEEDEIFETRKKSIHDTGHDKLMSSEKSVHDSNKDEVKRLKQKIETMKKAKISRQSDESNNLSENLERKKEILKTVHELKGDIFDLMHPDQEEDEIERTKNASETMKWYKSLISKYKNVKKSSKTKNKTNIINRITDYQSWLKHEKEKIREIENLPEDEQPFKKHWLTNQLKENEEADDEPKRAKDISIFNIERYDINDPRNIVNSRRAGS